MANLNESAIWEAGIYQWETSDPVQGGPNGIDNKPTRQLANRTLWLKTELAKAVASIGKNKTDAENMFARKSTSVTAGAGLTGGGMLGGNVQFALGTPGTCSGNTTNWAGSDTHTHQLAAASPTVAGVAKLINNLTTDDANSALSAAQGKKLQDEKLPYITENYHNNISGFNPGRNGFIRTNGERLNDQQLPSMEIHISHPSSSNGTYSRGIGFAYGHAGWGLTTTAWDEQGNYRGQKQILTEENGVMLTGDQTISGVKTFAGLLTAGRAEHWGKMRMPVQSGGHWFLEANPQSNLADGATLKFNIKYEQSSGQVRYIHFPELGSTNHTVAYQDWVIARIGGVESSAVKTTGNQTVGGKKTFSESADFAGGLRISGNNTEQWSGFYRGTADWYWNNPIAGKALQLKDDGTLALSGDKILLYTHRSGAVDLDRNDKIATSRAVKIVNDKIANAVPSGAVLHFDLPTAPPGWYELNGAAVPVSACPGLVAARYVGNSANATAEAYYKCTNPSNPNGSRNVNGTHIKLPDRRGEFLRAWDHGRGIDAGRQLGSAQGDAIRNIKGQFQADDEVGVVTRSFGNDLMGAFRSERNHSNGKGHDSNGGGGDIVSFDASRVVPTASENRPRNIALMLCIKA